MKCPNCSSEVAEGTDECPLCHFRLSGVPAGSPPVPVPPAVSADVRQEQTYETIQARAERKVPPFVYLGALILIAGVAWAFLRPIPGLPVPAGAFEDAESHFAVSPVAQGWSQTTTREKKGDFVEAVTFRKPDGEGPLRASFVVFVRPAPLPDFTEETTAQLQEAAVSGLSAVFEGYRQESTQVGTVDHLKALRLLGSLRRKPTAAEFEYKTTAILVPGADRAYLIVALAPVAEGGVLQALFDTAFDSFRVTERPLAHHQAVNAYFRIAAIAGAALLFLLVAVKIVRGILT